MLVWWARSLEPVIVFAHPCHAVAGGVVAAGGIVLICAAWWSLWIRGSGLPMNAYPTIRRVESGIYSILDHPVYVGAVLAAAGISLWVGSSAGLWVVTPTLACGCIGLVIGYERRATDARLGMRAGHRWSFLSIPPPGTEHVAMRASLGTAAFVLVPWLVMYEMVGHLPSRAECSTLFAWEERAQVRVWTEVIYASVYLVTPLAALMCRTRSELRHWALTSMYATAIGMLAYIAIPVTSEPRPFEDAGMLADLLRWERADGLEGRAAFPSFHVFWILLSARTISARGSGASVAVWLWACAAVASCWFTGMHGVNDLVAGAILFGVAVQHSAIWRAVVRLSEWVANSWHEWRFGPIRVIVHGVYAGVGAAVGSIVIVWAGGPQLIIPLTIVAGATLAGAGLFGQLMVGSNVLLRPFGYFGAVLGGIVGIVGCSLYGVSGWDLAAGLAIAAPWIQAIGRLRCLVQGCCHGRAIESGELIEGICYRHPRSRVVRLSLLQGVEVHPTPVYSVIGNVALGVVLVRLCWEGAAPALVASLYLVGAGMLRFVEEHFRGEPHTRVVAGLRVYQWFALASVITGVLVSGIAVPHGYGVHALSAGRDGVGWPAFFLALGVGTVYFAAMGVDFPSSSRRFSRLA